jgi:hypothetical protein
MATQAQTIANQANALHSTGPKTAAGKARSSRNNLQHGLTLGVLLLDPAEQAEICELEAKLRGELHPTGLLELEAFRQFIDGASRLKKIHALIAGIIAAHQEDPLIVPDCEAQLRQLNRYRAAAEMLAFQALRTLRELQTTRLYHSCHLTVQEAEFVPPLVRPPAKIMLNNKLHSHGEREIFYLIRRGLQPFNGRLPMLPPIPAAPGFASSKPS